jgi:O-antigen/teichoic acid export membrane protein
VGYEGRGLLGLFEAVFLGELLTVIALAIVLLPRVGLAFDVALFRQLATYTLPLVPNGVLQFCLNQGDRFVIKSLRGDAGWASTASPTRSARSRTSCCSRPS